MIEGCEPKLENILNGEKLRRIEMSKEQTNTDHRRDSLMLSTQKLYRDIDRCITNLVDARRYKDGRVQDVLHHMESLMTAALQQLGCVIDYLEEEEQL